ncbi:MAG: serine/threonine-protein phosphatase [Xanthomonadaceae bacterium]|nr:serine/threonine-protein phosphatase [Xanthomonadaceae bacterium]
MDRLLDLAGFRGDAAAAFRALRGCVVHGLPDVGVAMLHARGLPEGQARLSGLIAAGGSEVLPGHDAEHGGGRLPRFDDALAARCVASDAPLCLDLTPRERGMPLAQALLAPASLLVLPVDDRDRTGYRLVLTSAKAQRFAALDLSLLWRECRLAFAIVGAGFVEAVAEYQHQTITGLAEIQRLLQPADPAIRGLSFAVHWQPADTAAGDYYDLMNLSHLFPDFVDRGVDAWGVMVADVSGHGAAAAMEAVQFDAILRTYGGNEEPGGPAGALTYANRHFFSRRQRPHFLTVFGGGARPAAGGLRFVFVNGGHLPALRRRGGAIDWLGRDDEAGIPLGILREHRWHNVDTELRSGDLFVLYTDGIVEARDRHGAMFGSERLARCVADGPDEPDAVLARVREALHEHQDAEVGHDDQTLLVLRQESVGAPD